MLGKIILLGYKQGNVQMSITLQKVESQKQFDPTALSDDETIPVASLGSGLKVVARENKELTHSLATELLELEIFGPDRPLDDAHVARLQKAMERGTFRPELVQIMVCSLNGKNYRINGQHTCWARLYTDKSYRCPVQLIRYKASSENDMRMLYASVDRGKPRSKSNVINAYLFGHGAFAGFSKTIIKQMSEGFSFWMWGNNSPQHDGDEISYLLETDYHGLAMKVGKFLDGCQVKTARHLRRSPVYAAFFATFDKSESDAIEFWEAVRDGANLSIDDPRLKLRNHLQGHAVNAGRGGGSYKNNVCADDMFGWCIQAWNAFRTNSSVKAFRTYEERLPLK